MKITKIVFILLTAMLTLSLGISPAVFSADTIKVGDVQTYSKLASFTHPYRNGWQLALEEINKAGGVMGKKIEVISRDDQGKPGEAVKVAEEMVSKDKVALLMGSFFSNVGLAVTDFAGRNKVLYIAAEPLSDALVWAKGNRYTFRLRPSTYMQAAMLAEGAPENLLVLLSGRLTWPAVAMSSITVWWKWRRRASADAGRCRRSRTGR